MESPESNGVDRTVELCAIAARPCHARRVLDLTSVFSRNPCSGAEDASYKAHYLPREVRKAALKEIKDAFPTLEVEAELELTGAAGLWTRVKIVYFHLVQSFDGDVSAEALELACEPLAFEYDLGECVSTLEIYFKYENIKVATCDSKAGLILYTEDSFNYAHLEPSDPAYIIHLYLMNIYGKLRALERAIAVLRVKGWHLDRLRKKVSIYAFYSNLPLPFVTILTLVPSFCVRSLNGHSAERNRSTRTSWRRSPHPPRRKRV